MLVRVEGFCGSDFLCTIRETARCAAESATGAKLVLFKEKLNFKNPGGGVFLWHRRLFFATHLYPHQPLKEENESTRQVPAL